MRSATTDGEAMARRRAWRRDWGTTAKRVVRPLASVVVLGTLGIWRLHVRGDLRASDVLWAVGATVVVIAVIVAVVLARVRRQLRLAAAANPGALVALAAPVHDSAALLDQLSPKQRARQMPCVLVVRDDEVDLWSTADPPMLLLRVPRASLEVEVVALDLGIHRERLALRLVRGDVRHDLVVQGSLGRRSWGHRGAIDGLDDVLRALGSAIRPAADAEPGRPGRVAEQPQG